MLESLDEESSLRYRSLSEQVLAVPIEDRRPGKIICRTCEHEKSFVVETRASDGKVRRRRECSFCGDRFTTYEVHAADYTALLEKREELLSALAALRQVVGQIGFSVEVLNDNRD